MSNPMEAAKVLHKLDFPLSVASKGAKDLREKSQSTVREIMMELLKPNTKPQAKKSEIQLKVPPTARQKTAARSFISAVAASLIVAPVLAGAAARLPSQLSCLDAFKGSQHIAAPQAQNQLTPPSSIEVLSISPHSYPDDKSLGYAKSRFIMHPSGLFFARIVDNHGPWRATTIEIVDTQTNQLLHEIIDSRGPKRMRAEFESVSWSPDGTKLAYDPGFFDRDDARNVGLRSYQIPPSLISRFKGLLPRVPPKASNLDEAVWSYDSRYAVISQISDILIFDTLNDEVVPFYAKSLNIVLSPVSNKLYVLAPSNERITTESLQDKSTNVVEFDLDQRRFRKAHTEPGKLRNLLSRALPFFGSRSLTLESRSSHPALPHVQNPTSSKAGLKSLPGSLKISLRDKPNKVTLPKLHAMDANGRFLVITQVVEGKRTARELDVTVLDLEKNRTHQLNYPIEHGFDDRKNPSTAYINEQHSISLIWSGPEEFVLGDETLGFAPLRWKLNPDGSPSVTTLSKVRFTTDSAVFEGNDTTLVMDTNGLTYVSQLRKGVLTIQAMQGELKKLKTEFSLLDALQQSPEGRAFRDYLGKLDDLKVEIVGQSPERGILINVQLRGYRTPMNLLLKIKFH